MNLKTVILAAGQGTRMRSGLPKVLHRIAGKPLIEHVYETAAKLVSNQIIIVYGHGGERMRAELPHLNVQWQEQDRQLGTGHAVASTSPLLDDGELVLVLYGDVPLIRHSTLEALLESAADGEHLALLTADLPNPFGYGRIVRDASDGRILRIVEEKDATETERAIREINTGILAVNGGRLKQWLGRLENRNAQGEYYLTDIIAMAVAEGIEVAAVQPCSIDEVLGVNDRAQLAHLERVYQADQAASLMREGITLRDPSRFDLRGCLERAGEDIEIDINVVLEGRICLGDRVKIGPNCIIRDSMIGDDVEILANSLIEQANIGASSRIGPFARIRPETELADHVHIGNFVEVKKSRVASGSKINHLTYIGDSIIGSGVNVGAGTITCNYDGANKHQTIIGDNAFIGSDTQLVAPVEIAKGSTIGAGSTITRDTPPDTLTLSRSQQISIDGWRRPEKNRR